MGSMFFWPICTKEDQLSLSKIDFNKYAFYILREIMFLKKFTRNILPDIDKYPTSMFVPIKSVWFVVPFYFKLIICEAFVNFSFLYSKNI